MPHACCSKQQSEGKFKGQANDEKPVSILGSGKDEPGWPSFGQLFVDLSKLSLETLVSAFFQFKPSCSRSAGPKRGLTPLKDSLRMPEAEAEPPLVDRQSAAALIIENRQIHTPNTAERYSESKPHKVTSSSFKGTYTIRKGTCHITIAVKGLPNEAEVVACPA